MTRFVVDCETLLGIAAGEIEVAVGHQLLAPTLVRSQALSAVYEAARRGEISAGQGIERVTRLNSLKVRFLGDKVLQRKAWKVADQLGWETAYDAEFAALTQLRRTSSSLPTAIWRGRYPASLRRRRSTCCARPERRAWAGPPPSGQFVNVTGAGTRLNEYVAAAENVT